MSYQRTRIKICGVQTQPDIQAAIDAGADAVGFVFAENSPRKINPAQAEDLLCLLPPFIDPIGLFVNADPEYILNTAAAVGLHMVQLHGNEDEKFVENLANDLVIFKAVKFDPQEVQKWMNNPCIQMLLIDGSCGGKGKTFNWTQLANITNPQTNTHTHTHTHTTPFMLAGGLNPDNVAQAIQTVKPYAVDVSSGVESKPGNKNPALIYKFCNAVRNADLQMYTQHN